MSDPEAVKDETIAASQARIQRALLTALALCETLTPEEVEARNERMREQMYDRRANT